MHAGTVTAAFRSYQRVSAGDEAALQSAVALEGPIAIAMDALHNTFRVKSMYVWRFDYFALQMTTQIW